MSSALAAVGSAVGRDVAATGRVFVVVPVFNRWHFTRECLDDLGRQTYPAVTVVVSDGGSTDGTRDKLARSYPDALLAYDGTTRWWAGSCALAIDRVMVLGGDDDFVLLLNNDTRVPEDYVARLVTCSRRLDAAVGAKIVDSRDPSVVLDAGEFIDWQEYAFPIKVRIEEGEAFCDSVDTLPGRGSLVPLRMIRKVGNIDDATFPHYISDYDFFCRIKAAGFRLAVCYETMILAHIEETGIIPRRRLGFREAWREIADRRSMTNLGDHLRFVSRHAPPGRRRPLRRKLIWTSAAKLLFQTPLRPFTWPVYRALGFICRTQRLIRLLPSALWRLRSDPDVALSYGILPWPLQVLAMLTVSPRPFQTSEVAAQKLTPEQLVRDGIIKPLDETGWYMFNTLRWPGRSDAATLDRLCNSCRGWGWSQLRSIRTCRRVLSEAKRVASGATRSSSQP